MKHQPPATARGRRNAAPKHERAKKVEPRWRKLQRLGQAHLAPGMSLQRWQDLLALYKVTDLYLADSATIDGLIGEIREIVNQAKKGTLPK